MKAHLVAPVQAELGEGPCLFPDGIVRWVDLLHGVVYRAPDTVEHRFTAEVSKALPTPTGALYLGRENLTWSDAHGIRQRPINSTQSNLRCSDATVLPDGSLVFGVMDRDMAKDRGRLLRLDRDGDLHVVVEGGTIPNGVVACGDLMYFVESSLQRVDVFDLDARTGAPVNRRPFASIPENSGVPDGICIDPEGRLWVALWGGGRVVRLDAHGRIDAEVTVGVPHVSACVLNEHGQLVITTAAVLADQAGRRAGAGGLWQADIGCDGGVVSPTLMLKPEIDARWLKVPADTQR